MKTVGPKDTLIRMALRRAGDGVSDWIKPINGFRGSYLVITPTKRKLRIDSQPTICHPGANILSTYGHDNIRTMKPWRAKKNGKPYGALWVALRDNNGKKKYFKLDTLASEVFGDKWRSVKQQMQTKAFQDALADLF